MKEQTSNRGLHIGLAVALAFVVMILLSAESRCDAQQSAYQGAQASSPRASQFRLPRPWIPCLIERSIANVETADGTRHEQRDLVAQESSALWAFWLMVLASLQLTATIVGLIYIRKTLQEAVRGTEQVSVSNQISAAVAADQVAANRPLLILETSETRFRMDPWPLGTYPFTLHLTPTIRNVGRQACWIEAIWIGVQASERPEIADDPPGLQNMILSGLLLPNDMAVAGVPVILPPEQHAQVGIPTTSYIVHGVCQYRSLTGRIFSTRFGYHMMPTMGPEPVRGSNRINNKAHWRDGEVRTVKAEALQPIDYI